MMLEVWPAWGKTDLSTSAFHHLAHHSMDVAAVFERLIHLPVMRSRAEAAGDSSLTPRTLSRLSCIAYLHDIGKLHPGFQAKGWPSGSYEHSLQGHVGKSVGLMLDASRQVDHPFRVLVGQLKTWGSTPTELLLASFSHHGRPIPVDSGEGDRHWPSVSGYDWRAEASILVDAVRNWYPEAFEECEDSLPASPYFTHFYAGLVALADWVGSSRKHFAYIREFDPDYDQRARSCAIHALAEVGIDVHRISRRRSPRFNDISEHESPNPTQSLMGKVGLSSRLIILESETGSGKTESALWHFARLFGNGLVDGMYFAVPTRAAARQLHSRVDRSIKRLFSNEAPDTVLAIPGLLVAGTAEGQRLPNWRVLWDDQTQEQSTRWAAEHATRFLSATIAVGTVDQAMLAVLQVKHAHLRGSSLCRSLLVIDEVHASDAYMTEILEQLIQSHLSFGGYALLMSATLGSSARIRWTGETQPSQIDALSSKYPAIWLQDNPNPIVPNASEQSKSVHVELDSMSPGRAAQLAIEHAKNDARVLVIRNTTGAAIKTWREVQNRGHSCLLMQVNGLPTLHHSRFAAEDRKLLDNKVEKLLGVSIGRSGQGVIVIGTQTLEQSLDIDADVLITDLCPMDVLLQRIGRLHRHLVLRPAGFESPNCTVLAPDFGLDSLTSPRPRFENGLGAWWDKSGNLQGIYLDLSILELTRRRIIKQSDWIIPKMNRELVESAMHPEAIEALLREKDELWNAYHVSVLGRTVSEGAIARLNLLDRSQPYIHTNFPPSDESIMTRLGEEGIILNFATEHSGPFGSNISRISLPAHWMKGISADDVESVEVHVVEKGLKFQIGEQVLEYSTAGLTRSSDSRITTE